MTIAAIIVKDKHIASAPHHPLAQELSIALRVSPIKAETIDLKISAYRAKRLPEVCRTAHDVSSVSVLYRAVLVAS